MTILILTKGIQVYQAKGIKIMRFKDLLRNRR